MAELCNFCFWNCCVYSLLGSAAAVLCGVCVWCVWCVWCVCVCGVCVVCVGVTTCTHVHACAQKHTQEKKTGKKNLHHDSHVDSSAALTAKFLESFYGQLVSQLFFHRLFFIGFPKSFFSHMSLLPVFLHHFLHHLWDSFPRPHWKSQHQSKRFFGIYFGPVLSRLWKKEVLKPTF